MEHRDERFAELDREIQAARGRRGGRAGRPHGPSGTRYGFAALDRSDDASMRDKMLRTPVRENRKQLLAAFREKAIRISAAQVKAWETRRAAVAARGI